MFIVEAIALLLASAAPTDAAGVAAAPPAPDQQICKKEQVTGSLARTRKTCMTRAQWNKLRDRSQSEYDRLNNAISPTNGDPPAHNALLRNPGS
jgi:hypothetical protein